MSAINLGNIVGLVKSSTVPVNADGSAKTYVLWGKILNPSSTNVVQIRKYSGSGNPLLEVNWNPIEGASAIDEFFYIHEALPQHIQLGSIAADKISFDLTSPIEQVYSSTTPSRVNLASNGIEVEVLQPGWVTIDLDISWESNTQGGVVLLLEEFNYGNRYKKIIPTLTSAGPIEVGSFSMHVTIKMGNIGKLTLVLEQHTSTPVDLMLIRKYLKVTHKPL